MANYTLVSRNELANLKYAPTSNQTQIWNALGRDAGTQQNNDDNFFVKRGKSIENALGTTGASLVSAIDTATENANTEQRNKNYKDSLKNIAQKYGYNSMSDFYDASNAADRDILSKYNFDFDNYNAQRQEAANKNDQAKLDELDKYKLNFIENNITGEDANKLRNFTLGSQELRKQASGNLSDATKAAEDWKNYRENSYVGQKINQDRGKFAGSAINTLSTAADLTGLTANPLANAVQGGLEGVADELEQNGLQNFDAGRAAQNAAIGAATGAVTGVLNKGISNSLAKKGGNLFKGNNAITAGLNNLGSKTALGRGVSTIATGVGRGAVSGAVGGATGAGLSAALNGQDVLGSAVEGAKRGLTQGAAAGGIMAGANLALNNTPGVGKFMQDLNSTKTNWDNSGDTFNERLTNTLNSGDSAVGNWLNRQSQSRALATMGNIGNRVQNVDTTTGAGDAWDRLAQQSGYNNYDEVIQRYMEANPGVELNPNGAAGQILTWLDENPNTPTTATGWAKRAGERIIEDANNSNLGMRVKDISSQDVDDIKKMYINRNDMLGYTDDNTKPITVEEALRQSPGTKTSPIKQASIGDAGTVMSEALNADNNQVEPESISEKVVSAPTKTSKETKLKYAQGKELLAQYGTVDQPMARATKAPETFQKLSEMGFTKPEEVERISGAVTGANGAVSTLNKSIIESAKPVNTFDGSEPGQSMDDFIDNSIEHNMLSGTNQGKAVKRGLKAYLNALPSRAEGSITSQDTAADTFKVVQGLEARAAELEGRGGSTYHRATTEDVHQAAVLKDVANLLKDRIYDGADVKVAITPEVVQNLKSLDPGNKAWATTVDDFANTAKTPQDLRTFQKPFVRASRYIDNQYVQAATAGGRIAANAGELPDILPTTKAGIVKQVVNNVWNSNPAHRARAAVYGKLADNATAKAPGASNAISLDTSPQQNTNTFSTTTNPVKTSIGDTSTNLVSDTIVANSNYNPSTQLFNAIGRTEGEIQGDKARTAQYLANATNMANTQNETLESLATPNTGSSTMVANAIQPTASMGTQNASTATTQQASSNQYFQPTGDYWTDLLGSAMAMAIDANDVDAFISLYSMYQDALSQNQKSSGKDYSDVTNWSSADRTKLLSAQNAMDQIDQLESAYNNATGGEGGNAVQGWLRSRAVDISRGNWDPTASDYNSLAQSVGMGIVKNLINLGVTEADAQRYLEYLPALTDTKEQAQQKLDRLRSIYQSQINNLYSAYGL